MTNNNISGIYYLKGLMCLKKKILIALIAIALIFGVTALWHYLFVDVTYYAEEAMCDYWDYTWKWITFTDNDDADRYHKQLNEMLEELGNYDSYELNSRKRIQIVFESHGMTLVGEYSEENYEKQKKYILENYEFASKIDANNFKYELTKDSAFEFDINKWHFVLLNENDEVYYIPEYFRMVAFNDEENKIALLYYSDQDMDCFGDNNDEADLKEFTVYSFSYNFEE